MRARGPSGAREAEPNTGVALGAFGYSPPPMSTRRPCATGVSLAAAVCFAAVLYGPASPAGAQGRSIIDPERLYFAFGEHVVFALPGEASALYGHVDALPIDVASDPAAETVPAEDFGRVRLRLQPTLTLTGARWRPFAAYQVASDIDVLNDLVFVGDGREPLAHDPAGRASTGLIGARLQQLYALAAGPTLALKVGLTRSSWGLGVLANDGEEPRPDDEGSPFGFAQRSDRVVRAQLAVFPLAARERGAEPPLTVAIGFDGVIDDDTARWSEGDRAYNFISAVRGVVDRFAGGFYAVHRRQGHAEGGETVVTVLDLHARLDLVREPTLATWIEGEGAVILGSSSLSRSPLHEGSFDVAAAGGVGRFGVRAGAFTGVLEVGHASGDDNPFDDELRAFSFDREYRVGLLMFRELLRTSTAVSAYNLADPAWRGVPPRGYDNIATAGAVRGVTYVNPRVTVRPVEGLHLYAGLLYAESDADYVDPFRSSLAGGAPVGPNGALAASALGLELDFGVRYAFDLGPVEVHARAELAWLDPGEVFDRAALTEVDDIVGFWLHLGARW